MPEGNQTEGARCQFQHLTRHLVQLLPDSCAPFVCLTTHEEKALNKLQGDFFNWSPPKFPKYKSLYNLWHLGEILSQF